MITVAVKLPFAPIMFECMQRFALRIAADSALVFMAAVFRTGRLANSFPFAVDMLRRFGRLLAYGADMLFVIFMPFGVDIIVFV